MALTQTRSIGELFSRFFRHVVDLLVLLYVDSRRRMVVPYPLAMDMFST